MERVHLVTPCFFALDVEELLSKRTLPLPGIFEVKGVLVRSVRGPGAGIAFTPQQLSHKKVNTPHRKTAILEASLSSTFSKSHPGRPARHL